MSRKAFLVQVELDVQAVTCPGVWLCSNGKVSLQIYMLDSCVQTANYKPNFPIVCNETFIFYKTFYSKHQLHELAKELHDQWLYIELVQWQNCDVGNVLASFQTTLDELLYPSTFKGSIAGVDLDLLMEPTKTFPGTIAPKVEVSTKTTIEETLCACTKPTSSTVIVNPKVLTSTQRKTRANVCRRVCHSIGYSRRKRTPKPHRSRPPFCYRKAEDDLILRKPKYDLEDKYCSCRGSRSLERCQLSPRRKPELTSKQKLHPFKVRMCSCGSGHRENFCPVCSKYKGYFETILSPDSQQKIGTSDQPRTTLYSMDKKCYRHGKTDRCQCCRPRARALQASEEKSDTEQIESISSDIEQDKKRVCFCPEQKPSLAAKLHAKLTKTLSSIPRSVEWSCYDNEYECRCCDSSYPSSRVELYRDLQKFYGDLYEKTRRNTLCISDCPE